MKEGIIINILKKISVKLFVANLMMIIVLLYCSSQVQAAQDGEVYSFGRNEYGQLGQGDWTKKFVPTKIEGLSGVKAISAGQIHSLALLESGEVYSFGSGIMGQLGYGTGGTNNSTPTKIEGLTGVKAIAAGSDYSLVLLETGEVYSFGGNHQGQLGHGNTVEKSTPTKDRRAIRGKGYRHRL